MNVETLVASIGIWPFVNVVIVGAADVCWFNVIGLNCGLELDTVSITGSGC